MTEKSSNKPSFEDTFKIWVVIGSFFLVLLHFYVMFIVHKNIMSSDALLIMALVLIGYVWFRELRDRRKLQVVNQALIAAQVRLEHAEIDTIASLILAEEEKDSYTRGHSKRVSQYSLMVSQEMDLDEKDQKVIERAGLLHDLGKIGIRDGVLKKSSKLNDEEWEEMKKHPLRGVVILKPLEFLFKEKEIILHHHERYDGKGYPEGLKAEEIPLGARIVAVADIFDAMNSQRSYREPLPKEVIILELKKASGSQLDSSIVTVFLQLLEKSPHLWKRNQPGDKEFLCNSEVQ